MKKKHHNFIRLLEGVAAAAAIVVAVLEIKKHTKKESAS